MVSNPGGIYAEEKVCDKHNHGIEKNEKTISNVPINLLYLLTKKKKKKISSNLLKPLASSHKGMDSPTFQT
jgi:hypothetical protein